MKRIKLNRKMIMIAGLMCLSWGFLNAVSPDDFNKVTFVNNLSSDRTIEYLFFSPGDSQYWGPDVLDKEHVLAKGKKQTFFVFYPDSSASFDFMAIDSDGQIYETDNVQVFDGKEKTVTINERNLTNRTLDKLPMTEIIIGNTTDASMDFAFFAPADSKIWGLEVLNTSRTLRAGEEVSFLVLLAGEHFDMEFMALGEDGKEYQRTVTIGTSAETLSLSIGTKNLVK